MIDKSLIPKNTVLPLALIILAIVFAILYIVVDKKADEKDFKIFDVVTPILALIISVIGSIYVYNAYQAQREQIAIQKQEIEDSKRDAEYNRILDTIYRQLEFSNNELREYFNEINEPIKLIISLDDSFERLTAYCWMFKILDVNFRIFDKILNNTLLDDRDKILIVDIISTNLYLKPSMFYMQFANTVKNVGGKDNYINEMMRISEERKKIFPNIMHSPNPTKELEYEHLINNAQEYLVDVFENSKDLDFYLNKFKKY